MSDHAAEARGHDPEAPHDAAEVQARDPGAPNHAVEVYRHDAEAPDRDPSIPDHDPTVPASTPEAPAFSPAEHRHVHSHWKLASRCLHHPTTKSCSDAMEPGVEPSK